MQVRKKIFGLDVLRAIAITLVIVSHATYLLFPTTQNSVITLIRAMGAVGVDLFFVLSGFLIGGMLLKMMANHQTKFKDFSLFWKRRWLRTLPNYFVVLLLNIILVFIISENLPENILSYFVFLQNFSTPHPHFFTEAWSLSIEEYAYLLLPLVLYATTITFPAKNKNKLFIIATLGTIILLLLLKIAYYLYADIATYKEWSTSFRKVVVYRLDAIYLGFVLVYLYRRYTCFFNRYKKMMAVLGSVLFMALHAYIFVTKATPQTHLSFYVFVYLQGVAISLALFFPYALALKSKKIMKQLVGYISTRSYAIYLVNYSLVLLSIQHIIKLNEVSIERKAVIVLLYLVVTVLLSEALFQLVEQPFLRYRDKKYANKIKK